MKQSWGLWIALLIFCGVSAWAQVASHTESQAPTTEATGECGVLGICKGGEALFTFKCSERSVVVRRCQEGSSFEVGQTNFCVGPEKSIAKSDFMAFVKAQLDKPIWGDNKDLSKAEIAAARAKPDADDCRPNLFQQTAALENRIKILEKASASKKVIDDLNAQLKILKEKIGVADGQAVQCSTGKEALAKVEAQANAAISTICDSKKLTIPEKGSFLNTVLSQYDPAKHPCDTEADCKQKVILKSGAVVGTVLKRVDANGQPNQEHVRDNFTKFVWSPVAKEPMTLEAAIAFCESKTDLGLKWELPNPKQLEAAFSTNLREALQLTDGEGLWSSRGASISSRDPQERTQWVYMPGKVTQMVELKVSLPNSVRCLARPTAKK